MSWVQIMGYISIVSMVLPVTLILSLKLYKNRCLAFLLIYYFSTLTYNLMTEKILELPDAYVKGFGIINNLLDVPLALLYMIYFTKSASIRKKIHISILAFSVFEILAVLFFGFTKDAITIIMGPGILLVVGLSFAFFIEQIKDVIQFGKAPGKALMSASTLFLYGCFFIIYLFWYVMRTKDVENSFLVYFYVVTLSSLLMSIGLFTEKKRFKMLEELDTTRKELSLLYPNEKIAFPHEASFMDRDGF
ncbi:MAG: hypothetical protein JST09_10560 [Bacteroidetes bacterium]|nr:hypothetical protein [Bacteroidota bacterium]